MLEQQDKLERPTLQEPQILVIDEAPVTNVPEQQDRRDWPNLQDLLSNVPEQQDRRECPQLQVAQSLVPV
eukprot:CAMPEP_0172751676 /NCGR_PEP_ID=MMETSP1074-20121228/152289_1 /TAXON_ID=2916 /ORGANISM="Ceratium fusus, Strain PA161109" /LENGTH=69 /DNA_ID=CAMNT_0013584071 /DNA_START=75 /DNA_END=281 /DNA_ORIENTATION=+